MSKKMLEGSCHCGAVTFRAPIDTDKLSECNCSFCTKAGVLWSVLDRRDFALLSGGGNLTSYSFTKRNMYTHHFCKTCGVLIYADNNRTKTDKVDEVDINVRCIADIDFAALDIELFDGKSL
ncbi:MAG: GFA family protein [Hydrotalea sp.]|nr:GFA family protein [Hydrotalea sp.]